MQNEINFLREHGCWYDFTGTRLATFRTAYQFFQTGTITILWFFSLESAYLEGFSTNFDGQYYFLIILLFGCIHLSTLCLKRNETYKITRQFQELLKGQTDHWQKIIILKDVKKMWYALNAYEIILGIFSVCYYIIPALIDVVLAVFFPGSKIVKFHLSFDGFLDGYRRTIKYYLILIVSIVWPIRVIKTHIGCVGTLFIFITYLGAQIKILMEKTEMFSSIIQKKDMVWTTEENQMLKEIIDHHVAISRLSGDFKKYYGFPYATLNVIASVCICLTMVSSLNLMNRREYLLVAFQLSCVYIMFVLVFGSCFMGEYLQTQNQNLCRTLFNVPWYSLKPKVRKNVNFIAIHASIQRRIDFHGLSALNLHTFMQIINTSYSYFMMLKSML